MSRKPSRRKPREIGELGEFALIDRIRRIAGEGTGAQVVVGIGDDAAVLRPRAGEELVVSTDSLVEDVHFRWRHQSPRTVGRRALAVNLSDLAAMGARPLGCTLALCAPPACPVARFDGLLRGLAAEAGAFACPLVGGNLARGREVTLAVTVLGATKRGAWLRRDAARAGDRLFVTGTLGGAALARLAAEHRGGRSARVPEPRLAAGAALARLPGRGACIDVSDGFAADLGHLLEARGLGAEIDARALPRPRGFAAACARVGADPEALVAGGGEDYELLFTTRPGAASSAALTRRLGVRVSEVGRVVARPGIRGLAGTAPPGWRHFGA